MSKQHRMATASSARRDWPALGKLLPAQLSYPIVLGALLISAFAGVIPHIQAGLGVLLAGLIG